jgi:HK97 family phage major capsid protein/HK97 family phage prohead protease
MATYKGEEIDLTPTEAMAEEGQRFKDWRAEGEKGGTDVAVARATQLVNRQELSPETVRRMHSFFSRHEVDKDAEGFSPGEDGYPSPGRVAWAAWGGDPGQSWARGKVASLDRIDDEQSKRALEDEFGDATLTGLKNKVEEHNEEHGETQSKRVTLSMLAKVYKRGVGAFNTNPGSVRPGVKTEEQWAMARVNSFLYAVRNGRFRSGKHDTDLLPEGHPMKTETEERAEDIIEQRHVVEVVEDDETVTIKFEKHHEEMAEEVVAEERFDRAEMQMRAFDMNGEKVIDEETRTVRVGVSSEQPVKRDFGMEVMDHRSDNMNLEFLNSGRAPLLLDHDMERQIGVVESVELDEDARRLRAIVRFGKGAMASEVFTDVVDGIRQNISVGYRIDSRVEQEDDPEEYYRVSTTPMEISIVSIPADQSNLVGVGRSNPETLSATVETKGDSDMSDINLDEVRAEAAADAAKTVQRNAKDIMVLARKHNKADLGEEAIGRGVSIDEFRGELLEVIGNEPLETPAHVVDAPVKEQRSYSLGKMIRAQVTGDWREAGLEREMHDEIAQRTGKQAEGFYVPDFAFRAGAMSTAATGASGSENVTDNFVPEIHRGDMFIEALRAKQVMSALGVTYMGGLTNRIKMPKIATGAAAGFVEELGNVADQSPTDAAVTLQPRTLGAYADISRLLMKESVPAIDQVVQDDLLRSVADKIEFYAIQGSGSSGQPTGILNDGSVGNVDISSGTDVDALTWADITNIVKTVEDANGVINQATLGWLSNPKVKAKMANTSRVASTDSVMLMNDPWSSIYGYPAEFTSNVPSDLDPGDGGSDASALIFGDFSQLIVGLFGAPSILIDETTGGLAGTVRIIIHQDVDVALRNAVSFAKTDEVSVA